MKKQATLTHTAYVRCTREEHRALKLLASTYGMGESAFMRRLLRQAAAMPLEEQVQTNEPKG